MSLRDVRAFDAWSIYGSYADQEWLAVRDWIAVLAERSYQAPSIPVPELSEQPTYEVREAEIPYSGGVYIMYRCFYGQPDVVDLISVNEFFSDHWSNDPQAADRSTAGRVHGP